MNQLSDLDDSAINSFVMGVAIVKHMAILLIFLIRFFTDIFVSNFFTKILFSKNKPSFEKKNQILKTS